MQGLMQGKRGLIMGVANDHSIAWGIARTLAAHGAKLAFTYQGDALGRRVKPLAVSVDSDLVMPCDVEDVASLDAVFAGIKETWATLDFLVHAVAFSDKAQLARRYADRITLDFFGDHVNAALRTSRARSQPPSLMPWRQDRAAHGETGRIERRKVGHLVLEGTVPFPAGPRILLSVPLVTARSTFPSSLKSPVTTQPGERPTGSKYMTQAGLKRPARRF